MVRKGEKKMATQRTRIVNALLICVAVIASPLIGARAADPQGPTSGISVDDNGTLRGQAPPISVSEYLSDAARAALVGSLRSSSGRPGDSDISLIRKTSDAATKAVVDKWLTQFPSTIVETRLNGVRVQIVTPKDGIDPSNRERVLINFHSGRFISGAQYGGIH
jgi:hypothetical protein